MLNEPASASGGLTMLRIIAIAILIAAAALSLQGNSLRSQPASAAPPEQLLASAQFRFGFASIINGSTAPSVHFTLGGFTTMTSPAVFPVIDQMVLPSGSPQTLSASQASDPDFDNL